MPRLLILALMTSSLLSACAGGFVGPPPAPVHGGNYSDSVGFTGYGGDPHYVGQRPNALVQTGMRPVTAAPATGLSMIKITTRLKSRSDHAKIAIQRGAKFGSASRPITVAGQPLSFSLIEVNGRRFAVLNKRPEFFKPAMRNGTRTAFAAQVPGLTGCVVEGAGYGYGPNPAAPTGIALPLACG